MKASEEARRVAEHGLILRTQLDSGVHGTSISGQDDRDEMEAVLLCSVEMGDTPMLRRLGGPASHECTTLLGLHLSN